jgi:hypothetical protein
MRTGDRLLKVFTIRIVFLFVAMVCFALSDSARGQTVGGGGIRRSLPPGAGDPQDPAEQREALQKKADEFMQAGMKLRAKGMIQPAKTKFRAVIEMVGPDGAGGAAMSQLVSIQEEGTAKLEEARRLFSEAKYPESLKLAKRVKVMYANILDGVPGAPFSGNLARQADKLISEIGSDPRAQAALQELEAAVKAKGLVRLEKDAKKDRAAYYDLYKKLEGIAKRYPLCETGQRCAKRLNEIRSDRTLAKFLHEEEQRRNIAASLQRAEQYSKNGLHEDAARELRELSQRFPGRSMEELRRMAEKKSSN